MNFNSHKNNIADLIEIALSKNKRDLIARFKIILNKSHTLLKSDRFLFWLRQLGSIPCEEIPITKFGLQEVSCSLGHLYNLNRHSFESEILSICERLFTYSHEDDLCPFQSVYHYYVYLPDNKIFKESELGSCSLDINFYTS